MNYDYFTVLYDRDASEREKEAFSFLTWILIVLVRLGLISMDTDGGISDDALWDLTYKFCKED